MPGARTVVVPELTKPWTVGRRDLPTPEEVDVRVEGTVNYVLATGGRVVMDGQEVTQ